MPEPYASPLVVKHLIVVLIVAQASEVPEFVLEQFKLLSAAQSYTQVAHAPGWQWKQQCNRGSACHYRAGAANLIASKASRSRSAAAGSLSKLLLSR